MKELKSTRFLVAASLFAALVFVATMVIKIPTPVFGYVHIGDGLVLISGLLLGPIMGGLASALGSMLSDLLGGYPSWAAATFIIKFLTASAASLIFRKLSKGQKKTKRLHLLFAGIAGELVMTLGYFIYNIIYLTLISSGSEKTAFVSAVTLSLAEIPFNLMQGLIGIIILLLCYPILFRVSERYMIYPH